MKVKFKVIKVEEIFNDGEEPDVTSKELEVELVVKDKFVQGIWPDPDYEEMYLYAAGAKFTLDYDRDLYIKISKMCGEDVDPPKLATELL